MDFSLTAKSVVDTSNEVPHDRAQSFAIIIDHGKESRSKPLDECCYLRRLELDFIRLGTPTETG